MVSISPRVFALVVFCLVFCGVVRAHDPGLSTARVTLSAEALEITITYAPADVALLLSAKGGPVGRLDAQRFSEERPRLLELARNLLELRGESGAVPLLAADVAMLPGNNVDFQLKYARPPVGKLQLKASRLADLPVNHRELYSVLDDTGGLVGRQLLTKSDASLDVGVTPRSLVKATDLQPIPSFWGFFKLGVEHIPTGYDHLLFLLGLLLVCEGWRSILVIVSCFTIAHSLTLALATFSLVQISNRIVDPCIAASIIYVGVENIYWKKGHLKGRAVVTFFFGLVHGLGFAMVLRDLGVGDQRGLSLLTPLFAFNIGVEVGQILIAGLIFPLLWQLRKKSAFQKRGVPILSGIIAFVGLYWLLERTLFYFMNPHV